MTRKPRRVPERIQDMLDAIDNASSDLGEISKDDFLADGKTQRAVIESLIVIGGSRQQNHAVGSGATNDNACAVATV